MTTTIVVLVVFFLLLVVSVLGFFHPEIKRAIGRKTYRKKVYKVLHYYAEENDQLLLNNCLIVLPGDKEATLIDHLLLADKYVYVVHDLYYDGALYGNLQDPLLFNQPTTGKRKTVRNPVYDNALVVEKLETMVGVGHDVRLFVNVVCYNKSLLVADGMKRKEQGLFFLPVQELSKTIDAAEKDHVPPIAHDKSEKLIALFKDRSDKIKKEYRRQGRKVC